MIQIPVLAIAENDGVFTITGPDGKYKVLTQDMLDENLRALIPDYELALQLALGHWWAGRAEAVDKAAYDAAHCRLITWDPSQEQAVTYGN